MTACRTLPLFRTLPAAAAGRVWPVLFWLAVAGVGPAGGPSATPVAGQPTESEATAASPGGDSAETGGGDTGAVRWLAGFARVDVTPKEPVRMAGYGNRDRPSEGVDHPLHVRCLAIRDAAPAAHAGDDNGDADGENENGETLVLLSAETIGLPGSMTRKLAATLKERHGLSREQVVFCSTHTHTGPDLVSELSNIFSTPMSDAEVAAGERYRAQLHEGILRAVELAMQDIAPASLAYQVGESTFAANRRVLTDGIWSGFGVQPDGPVDHTVPVLRIAGPDGAIRGIVFNYACHCTTLGGDHYRIGGDWAGYAATRLESQYPHAVALSTIGCGADANPNPRGQLEMAVEHGEALANEVQRVVDGEMRPIGESPDPRFDYAALSFELPTREELRERLEGGSQDDGRAQTRRHAQQLLDTYEAEGRLPATYPVPIQAWKFGDELTMVFLGGEVVVDYALRLKRVLGDDELWVTAYANDVLGYIASERMRQEKGYEYYYSGVYYGLPGPWTSGTEDLLVQRVESLVRGGGRSKPLPPDAALRSLRVPDGYRIELVASEPVVMDPINIAFGEDGRLWVVEMGDYPEGQNQGRVKVLSDTDGDGVFDEAEVFLDGLSFPTGVHPWRDGVLVSAAPDIVFARDTDGDGRADQTETLYTGFREGNPQHRVNGFTYGLDHSLHLASGGRLGEISSVRTGETIRGSGQDVKLWPDSGRLAATSGRTQCVRSRDDWGRWFGNNNSRPMYHFPIDDAYLSRNAAVAYSHNTHSLFTPAVAPRVYPVTPTTERFNDLFAANRFTSACSSIVARSPSFRVGDHESVFVCEPVHNLVHRSVLIPDGATFRAERVAAEGRSEFLASEDPWFRPVRAAVGTDGALWVVDMYREVIEHPEWIPHAWQQQLDLRAGENRGRIYRICRDDGGPRDTGTTGASMSCTTTVADLAGVTTEELVGMLRSPIGPLRDMAQRVLLHRNDSGLAEMLRALASDAENPAARAHALTMLDRLGRLDRDVLLELLREDHAGLLSVTIRLAESRIGNDPGLVERVSRWGDHPDATVAVAAAVALGESSLPAAGEGLARIASRDDLDDWLATAVSSSATEHAPAVAIALLDRAEQTEAPLSAAAMRLLAECLATVEDAGSEPIRSRMRRRVASVLGNEQVSTERRLRLASGIAAAFRGGRSLVDTAGGGFEPLRESAWRVAEDANRPVATRCEALTLIRVVSPLEPLEREMLWGLLTAESPVEVQRQAIDCLFHRPDPGMVDVLAERWGSLTRSVRDHGLARVLSHRSLTERLLDLLESGEMRVRDLPPAARQQLMQGGTQGMKARAARLINERGESRRAGPVRRYLDAFGPSVAPKGETRQDGKRLFEKHCGVCHVGDESRQAVGPSLDNLTDRSDRALVEAVLDPNRAVEPKYENYLVLSDDDRIYAGVIESEVAESLTVAQADGRRVAIPRSRIVSIKATGVSFMPEGMEDAISAPELEAIIRYLQAESR